MTRGAAVHAIREHAEMVWAAPVAAQGQKGQARPRARMPLPLRHSTQPLRAASEAFVPAKPRYTCNGIWWRLPFRNMQPNRRALLVLAGALALSFAMAAGCALLGVSHEKESSLVQQVCMIRRGAKGGRGVDVRSMPVCEMRGKGVEPGHPLKALLPTVHVHVLDVSSSPSGRRRGAQGVCLQAHLRGRSSQPSSDL